MNDPREAGDNYYEDDGEWSDETERITYDRAEQLVEAYLRKKNIRHTRVKHVLTCFDLEYNGHNMERVFVALDDRCDRYKDERSGPTRFKIPEEYRE